MTANVVLAHGAAGGVGTLLVQLTIQRGARVIATASPDTTTTCGRWGPSRWRTAIGLTDRVRAYAPELGIHLIGNGPGADPGLEIRPRGRAEALRLLAEGRIDIPLERTHSLGEVADAHRASMTRHRRGKLVVGP